MGSNGNEPVLTSLFLNEFKELNIHQEDNEMKQIPCLICEEIIKDDEKQTDNLESKLQTHLLGHHHLMIADMNQIADLKKYCCFWKEKLANIKDLSELCAVIKTNCGPEDCLPSETYYMIGGDENIFQEDANLRLKLRHEKISQTLEQSLCERESTTFSRQCIFCKKTFIGNRSVLFDHLSKDHNFSVGHPDNIVYCEQFLNLLEAKLNQLKCLYCEKIFKSWAVLKEHMRKKGHKSINPNNRQYDQFYLINYTSPGHHWQKVKNERDDDQSKNEGDDEWSDWVDESGLQCICLFCNCSSKFQDLKQHLQNVHQFNFDSIIGSLEFYSKIKVINYIRRCVYNNKCFVCDETFSNNEQLLVHLEFSSNHYELISSKKNEWDSPEYFFSTYENDNLLHFLASDQDDAS